MMITGSSPDTFRDYNFDVTIPDTIEEMTKDLETLKTVVADIKELTGEQNGSFTSSFNTLINDLEIMTENPGTIAKKFENFKSISVPYQLGLSMPRLSPSVLTGFRFLLRGGAAQGQRQLLGKTSPTECKMFASSFYMDYNNVGRTADNREQTRDVTVWVATSQDQSQIIRRLIDNSLSKTATLRSTLSWFRPEQFFRRSRPA